MQNYMYLLSEWWYVLVLIGVMLISGFVKRYNLFIPVYNYLIKRIKNQKVLVALLSFIGGILPIPGRVIISAGLLDTIAPDDPKKRAKFGIIDYLATHHYYLWSPLEKTVLIPMAVLKLSYWSVLAYTAPLLVLSLLFLIGYIWSLDPDDVVVKSIDDRGDINKEKKPWYTWINWSTVVFVLAIILAGNFIKENAGSIKGYIEKSAHEYNFAIVSLIAFTGSFIMGSSSKFAGMTALLTSIFGLPYFTYIFALEFAGYLLSPCHKCVAIGMAYFKTPIRQYYAVLAVWSALLILVGLLTIVAQNDEISSIRAFWTKGTIGSLPD